MHLRELADEHGPVHRPQGSRESGLPERIGRYHVAGQLARGGMGSVHKARDVDLGRDVALKVLLDKHAGDSVMMRRFVEEAQISGQLQHPGVVPVHELGLVGDARPYIAMKLVKGQTLARLLGERKDPAAERQRFLSLFERICQPLAYAHARGVVHRDLKPSNIMVGAFGEVQVMDWGLAKVLGQGGVADEERGAGTPSDASVIKTLRTGTAGSDSLPGSVLGTPAYMPPEQARGAVERLDERCDVFGLGAILCEILTGKPPYTGATVEETYRQAQNGDLDDAYARIEACGADREVVDLARRSLAFEVRDRPRDAGEVDRAIVAYLDSLSERARTLEIQAAEARVRAGGERQARRLTAALALVVVVAAIGGALGFIAFERQRRDRADRGIAEVRTALAQAETLRDRARAAAGNAPEWELALEASQRAERLAAAQAADLLGSAAELRAKIQAEHVTARYLARLETTMESFSYRNYAAVEDELATTFGGLLHADLQTVDARVAVDRLRAIGRNAFLASALDLLAFTSDGSRDAWRKPLELAGAVDPDPFLRRAREAVLAGKALDLTEELEAAMAAKVPIAHLVFLFTLLQQMRDTVKGEAVARRALELYPEALWPYFALAGFHLRAVPPREDEGLHWLVAGLARHPRNRYAIETLQAQLTTSGRYGEALETLTRGVWALPGHGDFYFAILRLLREQDVETLGPALDAAIDSLERLLRSGARLSSLAREVVAFARARRHLSRGEELDALHVAERAESYPDAPRELADLVSTLRARPGAALASFASIDATLAEPEGLVPEGAAWRYFRGTTDPGSGLTWTEPGFDDGAWDEGPSGFGYADGDDRTILDDMRGSYTTLYLRRSFAPPPPARFARLELAVRVDDACVAYVNGREIGRHGLAERVRPEHTSLATITAGEAVVARFEIPGDALHEGANVVAVVGLNAARTSSDFTLAPAVVGYLVPEEAQARARRACDDLRASRGAGEAPGLLPYCEGKLLQLEGKQREAAAKFREVLRLETGEVQPFLRLAESILDAARDVGAAEELRALLPGADRRFVPLWDEWLALSFVGLERTPADLLPLLPEAGAAGGYGGEVRWLLETLARGGTLRIHCGGERYQTAAGVVWERDCFFRGGETSGNLEWGWLATDIHGTDDDALFSEERYFATRKLPRPGYALPLPVGRYRVRLHFAEIWAARAGRRVFDVRLEGKKVLENYDIARSVGFANLDTHTFETEVSDGLLDIVFEALAENPKLSALEVEPIGLRTP